LGEILEERERGNMEKSDGDRVERRTDRRMKDGLVDRREIMLVRIRIGVRDRKFMKTIGKMIREKKKKRKRKKRDKT